MDGYAFERQGANPSYAPAAADAIRDNAHGFDGLGPTSEVEETSGLEERIWADFSGALTPVPPKTPILLNKKHCPLWPGGGRSLVRRLHGKGQSNILSYAQACTIRGSIPEAFDFLTSIQGIGPKIASFFLRDSKELLPDGADVQIDGGERWRLQPIDVWVRRTVNQIGGGDMGDRETAQFIVDNSSNPERVNMGMWYFSSLVCGSQYRHESCLHDVRAARDQLENFVHWERLEYEGQRRAAGDKEYGH